MLMMETVAPMQEQRTKWDRARADIELREVSNPPDRS
jgi:hypothetical protein